MKLKAAGTWPRALRRMGELRSPEAGLETRSGDPPQAWTPGVDACPTAQKTNLEIIEKAGLKSRLQAKARATRTVRFVFSLSRCVSTAWGITHNSGTWSPSARAPEFKSPARTWKLP
jgi:hypothetical protein